MALNAIQPSPGSNAVITVNRGNTGVISAVVSSRKNIVKIPAATSSGEQVSFTVVAI